MASIPSEYREFIIRAMKLEKSNFWRWLTSRKGQPDMARILAGDWLAHDKLNSDELDAFCLNLKAADEQNQDEKTYLRIEAKKTREKIVHDLESIPKEDLEGRPDEKWIYATMSTCYFALGNDEKSDYYKELFLSEAPKSWEIETFESSRKTLMELIGR